MIDSIKAAQLFKKTAPAVEYCSIRLVHDEFENLKFRNSQAEPVNHRIDFGYMVEIQDKGAKAYACSSDFSQSGLEHTFKQAISLASLTKGKLSSKNQPHEYYEITELYNNIPEKLWHDLQLNDKFDILNEAAKKLNVSDKIIETSSSIDSKIRHQLFLSSSGSNIYQTHHFLVPNLTAIANYKSETQLRTLAGRGYARQGGMEILDDCQFMTIGQKIGTQALELLEAEQCPNINGKLLLNSDQMILQIHESIGHPLEIDRILGDERNYAGTSFVTEDMFGSYQYGSKHLNVSFDPTIKNELASYAYDDDGTKAQKELLIKDGLLLRGLGGQESQLRSNLDGVSNSRSSSWNRAPIDRMANLNLEYGASSFDQLLNQIDYGVFMESNTSWSIDDSRNKFQFGCEYARLIENGKMTKVLKNPNYRGVSSNFWRNLIAVGDQSTFNVLGTPNCGKGEPNQLAFVGHATPTCLFDHIDIFGGES